MNRVVALATFTALAGCPDNPSGNPSVLWMAPDQNETHVKLVGTQPGSY
ncbi:MAG TPA: hypothetical protein VGL61_28520 [Kofleriaceae bacterium]|jgi:hypothetical protein